MSTESTTLVLVEELETAKELALIAPQSALALKQSFVPHFVAFKALREQASQIAVNSPMAAREMRLSLRKVRVAADKTRKAAGEEAKRYKEAVDGVYKILEAELSPVETRMEGIEQAEAIADAARKEGIRAARTAQLIQYQDPSFVTHYDLANMSVPHFDQLLAQTKLAKETADAAVAKVEADRIAAAKLAEEQRIAKEAADKAERDRLAAENAKLAAQAAAAKAAQDAAVKKAAQEKAVLEAQHAKKLADERKVADAKAAAEKAQRDALEAEAAKARKVAADKLAQEQAKKDMEAKRIADAERLRREALEAQLKTREAADIEKARATKEASERAAKAPDKTKLAVFANSIRTLSIPQLTSEAGVTLTAKIALQVGKFAVWIETESGKL